jgi:RNA polymerase sigma factor (sigma-70 family)
MMNLNAIETTEISDADLVAESLLGDKEAFSTIVARYQTLICSLAYSGIGNLSQSEDIAQETFVAAWKQLSTLREPHKLRAWLCGIARNLTGAALRKQGREPAHGAESLEVAQEFPSRELLPPEQAITREEQSILWRSLERIPHIYREPMVLFYREHQSIQAVAENLDLSEDAVKQRLSRGRKMLQEQVVTFVEGALGKTSPGKVFTLAVMAVLPAAATSAKAATVGAGLVTGGAAAKSVLTLGSLGTLLAVLGSAYVSLRAQGDNSKSPRERQFLLRMFGMRITLMLLSFVMFFVATNFAFFRVPIHFDYLMAAFLFYFCVDAMYLNCYQGLRQKQLQIAEGTYVDAEWRLPRKFTDSAGDSARSKMNDRPKVVGLAAFGIVTGAMTGTVIGALGAMVATQRTWHQQQKHLGHLVLLSACIAAAAMVVLQLLSNAGRDRLPRFRQLQQSRPFFVPPIIIGLCTLWIFNLTQYTAHTVGNKFNRISPTGILVFNLVVVLTYAGFIIAMRAWRRKNRFAAEIYTLTPVQPGQLKAVTIVSVRIRAIISDAGARGKAIQDLFARLADAHIRHQGKPISILNPRAANFNEPIDIEIGIPVADGTLAPEGCQARVLESVPSVIAVFRGPTTAAGRAYCDLLRQMRRMKKSPTGELRQHSLLFEGAASPNNIIMLETPTVD